jgi:hypothetical protein
MVKEVFFFNARVSALTRTDGSWDHDLAVIPRRCSISISNGRPRSAADHLLDVSMAVKGP